MLYKVSDARSVVLLAVVLRFGACLAGEANEERVEVCGQRFTVEGRAFVQGVRTEDWVATAAVLLDGGEHIGFIRLDGSFTVNDVAPGSYVLHVTSPTYRFEPVRVDVTTQGKIRARKVNYIKPYEVVQLSYPLLMKCSGLHSYFIARETWGLSDFLMNPMVLMMVLPLVIILLLPKVMDAEGQAMTREMEESMNRLNNPTFPDVSELMAKYFNPPRNQSKPGRKARGHRGGSPRRK